MKIEFLISISTDLGTTRTVGSISTRQALVTVICEHVGAVQLKIEPVPPKVYLWGIQLIPAKESVYPKSDISAERVRQYPK